MIWTTNLFDSRGKRRWWPLTLRFAFAVIGWICCYWFTVDSAKTGISRLFTTTAIFQSGIESADSAVKLAPKDPEAHYTSGLLLVNLQRLPEAVVELKQAIELRPHYYYQWLDLGVTLDRLGDQAAAEGALRESVRLAPFYAQPRWQLGNFLFRQGLYQEAFEDLQLGVRGNPSLSEGMFELAWVAADGDVKRFEALTQSATSRKRFELAAFFARQGQGPEAAQEIRAAGTPEDERDLSLLHETITQLLSARKFDDAYAVWVTGHATEVGDRGTKPGHIVDGNFMNPIPQNDPGFGWQLGVVPDVRMSIDPTGPQLGARSLRIEYQGDSPPGSWSIRQVVLLEKHSRYSLNFVARADQLVTGGAPIIVVLDAVGGRLLGQSNPISVGSTGWIPYKVDFDVDEVTSAATIGLQRQACSQSPCPVFGRLWLSGFSLAKI